MGTISPIYFIANANNLNTVLEVLACIDQYYPDIKDKFTVDEIRNELRSMSELVLGGERLYPNIRTYGIHTYHVLSNGYCIHEDDINDWVNDQDDTSISQTYKVDGDLVPVHFNETEDDTGNHILSYYNGKIEKPVWLL